MQRFATIGVGAGKRIDVDALSPEMKQALANGIADAWKEMENLVTTDIASGRVTSGDLFGTREYLKNNYLYRFAGAVLGIYANSKDDAIYPMYRTDADGGVTIYIQNDSPGEDKEANWLPAPDGPFWSAMRLYWPAAEALDGSWSAPQFTKIQ